MSKQKLDGSQLSGIKSLILTKKLLIWQQLENCQICDLLSNLSDFPPLFESHPTFAYK